ncbi:MAG: histidinol-phosphatase [Wujia sp.]
MIANYHTHTYRCKHAKGEDREYIEAAITGGLKILGMSDHCPFIYDTDYVSGTRMLPNQIDDYFSCMEALREEYKKEITIYIGFEAEYVPEQMEAQNKLLEGYPIDFMIMGEHFTGKDYCSPYTGFETENESELAKYVDVVIEGMETGKYRYLAHPDLMNYVGDERIYDKHFTRLCEYLKHKNIPVEINMLGLVENRHYPSVKFFEIAKRVGNTAIIGCDAHSPDRLSNREYMDRCEKWCRNIGLELIDTLPGLDRLP